MQTNYTPSVNIIRDKERAINYIPTPNACLATENLFLDIESGVRSFNIIGSYGTGKSSFLWAFEQSVLGKKHFFEIDTAKQKIKFINWVGEFKSLKKYLADYFELDSKSEQLTQDILDAIFQEYHTVGKKKTLFLLIDEFGKFLEYAAKNNPEDELYFIQMLAEFANNSDHNIVLITTVHQNFDAYSFGLSSLQQQEWKKVKGRFKELPFNETVEQLVYLGAERLSQLDLGTPNKRGDKKLIKAFNKSRAFATTPDFAEKVSVKLFPLDLWAANVITLALQRYGQNDRSLFSFLESQDFSGLYKYDKKTNPYYNLANVHDNLVFNFYSYINSRFNIDKGGWSSIKTTLERIENEFIGDVKDALKVIKSIGLLNIFTQSGAVLDDSFFVTYSKYCLGIETPEATIEALRNQRFILYRNHSHRYVLNEGTDVDIFSTIQEAGGRVGEIEDIASLVERNYSLQPIFAKAHYYKTGTPRLFEFFISNRPVEKIQPVGEIDGYINLIFNDDLTLEQVREISETQEEAVLYGYYTNSKAIKDLLFEIERTKKAKESVSDRDMVALRELESILQHQKSLLNHYILHNLFNGANAVSWFFKGKGLEILSKRDFNKKLSSICSIIYSKAPAYKNELVNRHKLPSPIYTAKRNYISALTKNWGDEHLGFLADKFPPEKTIFITLLKENGLFPDVENPDKEVQINPNSSFNELWNACNSFLEESKKGRRRVSELVEMLSRKPFKLKSGLIDFWLPSYLFIKRNDFALFYKDVYLPELSDQNLELVLKKPKDYEVKAFDLDGVRLELFNGYRSLLEQAESLHPNQKTFIQTIKPFLTFYKQLPKYAHKTKRLSKEAIAVRNAIANAKEPEKTFFEDFPLALGYSIAQLQKSNEELVLYSSKLQIAIKEIRTCFDALVDRFEAYIQTDVLYDTVAFIEIKERFVQRYEGIKKPLLLSKQRVFVQRLFSELDNRRAWYSSIAQAITGKTLERFEDKDEVVLFEKFKDMILHLDNLTEISLTETDEEKEDAFQLSISSFDSAIKQVIKLPKKKSKDLKKMEEKLQKKLGKDKSLNIAALTNVLKELLKD